MSFKLIFPYLIIAFLMWLLITDGGGKHKNTITTGGQTGEFIRNNPQPVVELDTIYKDSVIQKVVVRENPVNKELLAKYTATKDTLDRLRLYKEAIKERKYSETYLDGNQKITVNSDVIGTLLRQELKYNIGTTETVVKNPSEGLYMGLGVQIPYKTIQLPMPEVNLSYLKNNKMYTLGVNPTYIRLNYKQKLF